MTRNTTLTMLAALTLATLPAAALAGETESGYSARVPFGDLQLTSKEGAVDLRRRVRNAAFQVCRKVHESSIYAFDAIGQCAEAAFGGAKPQVDRVIARARAGHPLAATAIRIRFAVR